MKTFMENFLFILSIPFIAVGFLGWFAVRGLIVGYEIMDELICG